MASSEPLLKWSRIAATISLLPILFGVGFTIYAFAFRSVTKIVISDQGEEILEETIVDAGGVAGVLLAFAPLVLGLFVAILLHLARNDADQVALNMAWAFSGFVAVASLLGASTVGVYLIVPAVLMLVATGVSQFVINRSR